MEKNIDRLRNSIAAKAPPLKLAQSRLKKRLRRPEVELCNDEPHRHLTEEVRELMQMIRLLENKLQESDGALADLFKNKERLEQNIRVKKNSIMLDQQRCMSLRKHFPYLVVSIVAVAFKFQ